MHRRSLVFLPLLAAVGCGGAGQSMPTPTVSPMDSTVGRSPNGVAGAKVDPVFKPTPGPNSPLGTLRALAANSPLAKAADGKPDKDSVAKLAKLDKGALGLDDAYGYVVAGAESARATVGEKGASVPLPTDAKANPDGSYWVVDAETRRVFTLAGVKRDAEKPDKPATVADAPSADLVHPMPDSAPALGLVARADEATTEVKHALRIVVKGVGAEGAPEAGARVRLKKTATEKGLPPLAKAMVRALKKYGATLAPGEGAPVVSALADPRWTKEDGQALGALRFTDFELIAAPAKPVNSTKSKP